MDNTKETQFSSQRKHFWGHGFALGLAIVLTGTLISFFLMNKFFSAGISPVTEAPTSQLAPGTNSAEPGAPAADSEEALKHQLEQVFAGIREANQKKDLSQLLSLYSPNFPQLTQRAQGVSKAWKIYDYQKMDFQIKSLKPARDHVTALVQWDVEAQNISTRKIKNLSRTYLITFVNESGQWRIKALDETG